MDYHISYSADPPNIPQLLNYVFVGKDKFKTLDEFKPIVKKIILEHGLFKGMLNPQEAEEFVQKIEENKHEKGEYVFDIKGKELIIYWS